MVGEGKGVVLRNVCRRKKSKAGVGLTHLVITVAKQSIHLPLRVVGSERVNGVRKGGGCRRVVAKTITLVVQYW